MNTHARWNLTIEEAIERLQALARDVPEGHRVRVAVVVPDSVELLDAESTRPARIADIVGDQVLLHGGGHDALDRLGAADLFKRYLEPLGVATEVIPTAFRSGDPHYEGVFRVVLSGHFVDSPVTAEIVRSVTEPNELLLSCGPPTITKHRAQPTAE